jgi:hypothetical protein
MTRKTIKRATADIGLILITYNLRRTLDIIGKERLRCFVFDFFSVFDKRFDFIGAILANGSKTAVYFA